MEECTVVVAIEAVLEEVAAGEGCLFGEELEEEVAGCGCEEDLGGGWGFEVVDGGHCFRERWFGRVQDLGGPLCKLGEWSKYL